MKCSLMFPVFLKRLLVFPILLFSSISLHFSLKKVFLSLLVILWTSAFSWVCLSLSLAFHFLSFFSYLFVKPHQATILASCVSFCGGWFQSLPPVQTYRSLYKLTCIVLQAFCPPNLPCMHECLI